MKSYLSAADAFLAKCLGLTGQNVTPECLKITGKGIMVLSTESNQRHSQTKNVNDFMSTDFEKIDKINRKKLGLALGKAIAEDLVISFEPLHLKK